MVNAKQLRYEAERLREQMRTRLNDAEKSTKAAEELAKTGEGNKAKKEDEAASQHYREAVELERKAADCDRRSSELETKAANLDRQENELRQNMQDEINRLEQRKRELRGDY
ncbi:MAG: hypothetical protein WBI29_00125 [Candidatus Saccharimonadales bacterium]